MNLTNFYKDIKEKKYSSVYFLTGDESFFIDKIVATLEKNILSSTEKEFNQTTVYGADIDIPTLVATARRYPMMADYQVIIVREAQGLKKLEELENYLKNPQPTTILIIAYKKDLDKRKTFYKTIQQKANLLECDKIKEYKLVEWISNFVQEKQYTIQPKAATMLAEFLGNDLAKINNELEKIYINIPAGTAITELEIEKYVGISKEYNAFEFQNAIMKKNKKQAYKIATYLGEHTKDYPFVMLLPLLYGMYIKIISYHAAAGIDSKEIAKTIGINPYFLKDYEQAVKLYPVNKCIQAIQTLKIADLQSKGMQPSTHQNDIQRLQELVFKLLH